jgi:uncharacterized membrane protein YbhN (UPF0104 family)
MPIDSARRQLAVRIIAVLLTAFVVVALVRVLRQDGPAALEAWRAATVSWPWIALGTMYGFIGHAIYVFGWRRLLIDLGVRAPLWDLVRMFLVSNLGRYLPGGKAWQMGIIGVMSAEAELPAALIAGTSLLQGTVGVAVGAVVLLATGGAALGVSPMWYALPVAGVLGIILLPAILRLWTPLWNATSARVPGIESVTAGTMWTLVWTCAGSWIAWGFALHGLAHGLLPDPAGSIATYIAAWTGPFLAGLIAFMIPAGLGVRDGVLQKMLVGAGVATSSAMVLVVVHRVWITAVDVIPAVIVLAIRRRRGQPRTPAA